MSFISTIEEIIQEVKSGRPFILVDGQTRENEGDLVIPAEFITAEYTNFMIKNCSGIICLTITSARARQLNLRPMIENNQSAFSTPFAVSIEAKKGISTGVSALDRTTTIKAASAKDAKSEDIVSPGHIFPLIAKDGGVLVRAGHTEGSTDICRLAGLEPAAVICEVMNEDGSMARMPDLISFASKYNFKIATIEDLIEYRRSREQILHETSKEVLEDGSKIFTFSEKYQDLQHFAIIKGDIAKAVVRIESFDLYDELKNNKSYFSLLNSLKQKYEDFVFIIINKGRDLKIDDNSIKEYGKGAMILKELGLQNISILTKRKGRSFTALRGFGIEIVEEILI